MRFLSSNCLFLGIFTVLHISLPAQTLYNSWLGNSGGTSTDHIMHNLENMYVRPDGTIYAITLWDEGGHNVSVFNKNGIKIAAPYESGTGSWGRNSGPAVYANNQYIYQLKSQHGCAGGTTAPNTNGLPQYPPCNTGNKPKWNVVHRYNQSGGAAPFSNGYGFDRSMLIVNIDGEMPRGICQVGNELFVSDPTGEDTIKVYDINTLSSTPNRKFVFQGAANLYVDSEGKLWTMTPKVANQSQKIFRFSPSNGSKLTQEITLPQSVNGACFHVDIKKNKIYISDKGVAQNILIYKNITTSPVFEKTFGVPQGIYSGAVGVHAPLKFNSPSGIGTDTLGNIYVASNGFASGNTTLEGYDSTGVQKWILYGLIFTAAADASRHNISDIYTFDKWFTYDPSKGIPGKDWKYMATTLNPFKYPDDPRLQSSIFYTSNFIRNILGHKFLYITDMYSKNIAGYRFNDSIDSAIAIPCMFLTAGKWTLSTWPSNYPVNKEWIWVDKNANAKFDAHEYDAANVDNEYITGMYVDEKGGLWKGLRENGIRYFPCNGLDSNGVPQYSYATSTKFSIPAGIKDVKRIFYDTKTDELFLAGFSVSRPDTGDTWWAMGTTICKYQSVLQNNALNLTWQKFLEFYASGSNTKFNAKSFYVEGDYIFVILFKDGVIRVYNRNDFTLVDVIKPSTIVGNASGWTDINVAISVKKLCNNQYKILAEENGYSKIMVYLWCPNGTCPSYQIPPAPVTDTLWVLCQNTSSMILTASGTSLKWYTANPSDTGSYLAPTPPTAVVGASQYYVSQSNNGCEGPKAKLLIEVRAPKLWYRDADGDSFGNLNESMLSCAQPLGYVSDTTDMCPSDVFKRIPGTCGCGKTETDCLDCIGVPHGSAFLDSCEICAGGSTGKTPITNKKLCVAQTLEASQDHEWKLIPNPVDAAFQIASTIKCDILVEIYDAMGELKVVHQTQTLTKIQCSDILPGICHVRVLDQSGTTRSFRMVKID